MSAQSTQPTPIASISNAQLGGNAPITNVAQLDASNMSSAAAINGGSAQAAKMAQASEGVQIIRNGVALPASTGTTLQLGDKIIVPANGTAKAVFNGQDGQAIVGTFVGGTEATLTDGGAGTTLLDLASGDVDVAPASDSDAVGLIVAKDAGGSVLSDFLLAGLIGAGGAALIAAANNDDESGPTGVPTNPTDPTDGPTDPTDGPTDPTDGPTDPTDGPTDPTDGPTDPTDSHGLITSVQDVVAGLAGGTLIEPVSELLDSLLNPNEGALSSITSILESLTNTEGGALGVVTDLVDGLVNIPEQSLEPLISTLNDLLAGLANPGNDGIGGVVHSVLGGLLGKDGVLDGLLSSVGDVLGQDGLLGGILGQDGLLGNVVGDNGLLGGVLGGSGGLLGGISGGNGGTAESGLITTVQDVLSNLSGGTVIEPVGQLLNTLIDPSEGSLSTVTGLLEDLTSVNDGPLGVLTELVNGLATVEDKALEPVISTLNELIAGLTQGLTDGGSLNSDLINNVVGDVLGGNGGLLGGVLGQDGLLGNVVGDNGLLGGVLGGNGGLLGSILGGQSIAVPSIVNTAITDLSSIATAINSQADTGGYLTADVLSLTHQLQSQVI
ncbi:hypothetical protein [Comamonas sp. wu1-DMT]|uniref:hypothetical protein n=1 Tax=Comamonas sp. wu1-DMT TaxID=3126390 RepID=UPI0032E3B9F4